MIFGSKLDFKKLIKTSNLVKKIYEINNINDFKEIQTGVNKFIEINNFKYHKEHFKELKRILQIPFYIFQETNGLIICRNHLTFILMAPVLM